MKKLVVKVSMFDSFQHIKIFSDGLCTGDFSCELDDLPYSIAMLAEREQCNTISLFGSSTFLNKIKSDISTEYIKQYNKNDIIININS